MESLAQAIEIIVAIFRERVSTEAGLGWVAYPKWYVTSARGVLFEFSTPDQKIQFPSIEFSATDLATENQLAIEKLAWQKWRTWRAKYEAERGRASGVRRRRIHEGTLRMSSRRYRRQ